MEIRVISRVCVECAKGLCAVPKEKLITASDGCPCSVCGKVDMTVPASELRYLREVPATIEAAREMVARYGPLVN